jgi:hypothetical protein
MTNSHWIILPMRNISEKYCRENQNNHFMLNKFHNYTNPRKSCPYEIMCENKEQPDRPHVTIQYWTCAFQTVYIRIHTLRMCNTYCFSTANFIKRTRLSITLFVYCLSCLPRCLFLTLSKAEFQRNAFKAFVGIIKSRGGCHRKRGKFLEKCGSMRSKDCENS